MERENIKHNINPLIADRWSLRAFSSKTITDDDLMLLFEAARWAPSAMNEQPWEFIAVKKENEKAYSQLAETLNEGNREWAAKAPVLIIVSARKTFAKQGWENNTAGYSTGHAVANLTTQAMEQGIHVHQMGGFDKDKVRTTFNIDENKEVIVIMALGYSGDSDSLNDKLKARELAARKRKALDEFVKIL